jgi:hypothetical protein
LVTTGVLVTINILFFFFGTAVELRAVQLLGKCSTSLFCCCFFLTYCHSDWRFQGRVWYRQKQSFGVSPMVLRPQPLRREYNQLASGTSWFGCRDQSPGSHNCGVKWCGSCAMTVGLTILVLWDLLNIHCMQTEGHCCHQRKSFYWG